MKLKLKNVVPFATAAKTIFDANPGVKTFDTNVGGTWETTVFVAAISNVETMNSNLALQKQKTADYKQCQLLMKSIRPTLSVLTFRINQCITSGSIAQAFKTFAISPMRTAISKKDINGFHAAYITLYTQLSIAANKAALIAAGYSAAMISNIKNIHDGAYLLADARILSKQEIKDNTAANKITVTTCNSCSFQALSSLHSFGISISDIALVAQSTQVAVMKAITPAVPPKPRNKNIKSYSSIIAYTNMLANRMLQFTQTTEGINMVFIGRTNTKEGIPTDMKVLTKGVLLNIKNADIPGTGKYIKIINKSLVPARVVCFVIVP